MSWFYELVAPNQEEMKNTLKEYQYIPDNVKSFIGEILDKTGNLRSPNDNYVLYLKTEGHIGDGGSRAVIL